MIKIYIYLNNKCDRHILHPSENHNICFIVSVFLFIYCFIELFISFVISNYFIFSWGVVAAEGGGVDLLCRSNFNSI